MRAFLPFLAAASFPLAAAAAPTGLETDWVEFAFSRCAEPMIAQVSPDTAGLVAIPEAAARALDFRSNGRVWRRTGRPVYLIHMEHARGAEVFSGCRVDFEADATPGPPLDVPTAISAFEDWVAANLDSLGFIDATCAPGPRLYARKVRSAAEVRPGVHLAVVMEAGEGGSFLFFAAVEEPAGVGGCPTG